VSTSGLPVFDKAGRFTGYRGVAPDITERKRASEALREAQMQLAHANRVATMGQLTASIAHEVNQPIAATVTNAEAALRFLNARRPDLDEVREALGWIVRDGDRQAPSSVAFTPSSKGRRNATIAWRSVRRSAR
jgi:signal transduction histidine kinase